MTLNIAMSRPRSYILGAGDTGVYLGSLDEDADPGTFPLIKDPPELPVKTTALSSYVLANTGGCPAIQADFRRLMAECLEPGDDLDACYAAARDVAVELIATDRPGEEYPSPNVPGGIASRMSILNGGFALIMNGFRHDGTTGVVQYQPPGQYSPYMKGDGFEDFDDPDLGEFTAGAPYGVPIESLIPFFDLLEAPLTPAEAFSHVYGFQRSLLRKHPDRLTRDMRAVLLLWRDDAPPEQVCFGLNVDSLDQFGAVYELLAALEVERTAEGITRG
jgi:hypothetical protein